MLGCCRNLYRRTRAATAEMDYVRDRKFIPPTCLRLAKTLRIDFAEAMSANLRREMTENCGSRPKPLRGGKRSCGKHDWGVCPQHGRQFGAGDGARRKRPYGNACQPRLHFSGPTRNPAVSSHP